MRVLDRDAGLAGPAQTAQHEDARADGAGLRWASSNWASNGWAGVQPGVELGQQSLAPGQEDRPESEPNRVTRHFGAALIIHPANGDRAPIGAYRSRRQEPITAGCGYFAAEPGNGGLGGATLP